MSVEISDENDSLEGIESFPETGGLRDTCAGALFWAASYFTDPICKAHQLFRRISTVDSLHTHASYFERSVRKGLFGIGMVAFGALGIPTAPVGILLRKMAIMLQSQNFHYTKTDVPIVKSPSEFTLYTHNFACPAAGYAISDAGVTPWPDREQEVTQKIKALNANFHVAIEIFDTQIALRLEEALKDKYAHIYHSLGKRPVGVCSGLFIASQIPVKSFKFTPFPTEYLVGRTKSSSKGFAEIELENDVLIIATHLQHSEECKPPTLENCGASQEKYTEALSQYQEEKQARANQMAMIGAAFKASTARLRILTGDLNMGESEWESYALNYSRDPDVIGKPTWGGDEWYAKMVGGKRISGPMTLDYTAIWRGGEESAPGSISTKLIKTSYDAKVFKADALSDHLGHFNTITIAG